MDNLIKIAEASMWAEKEVPSFKSGDTITVTFAKCKTRQKLIKLLIVITKVTK